jgi:hypothetical protein
MRPPRPCLLPMPSQISPPVAGVSLAKFLEDASKKCQALFPLSARAWAEEAYRIRRHRDGLADTLHEVMAIEG